MPDYTTIAQRIAEARRRGCKVKSTFSGAIYDPDNLPLYVPDHDADCKSHGVSIVEPEVPAVEETWNGKTSVRCYRDGDGTNTISAYVSENEGVYFECGDCVDRATEEPYRLKHFNPTRIDPDAALASFSQQPASRRKLREMFAANPVVEPPPLAPCPECWGECRSYGPEKDHVVCVGPQQCGYGWEGDGTGLPIADHPVRPDRVTEIVALFRELNERLGKLLEGK